MKKLKIKAAIRNEVVEMYVAQNGERTCTAHDLYYAMNEAPFYAACQGFTGSQLLRMEENLTRALAMDWKELMYMAPLSVKEELMKQTLRMDYEPETGRRYQYPLQRAMACIPPSGNRRQ